MDLKRYQQQLAELVAQPSVSCTIDSIDQSNRGVIDLLAQWFSDRGFETSVFAVDSDQTKYNLVAKLGSGEDGLVLSGHTDTVPYNPEKWQQEDPLKLENKNDRLYGLGATDMKGFFPAILAAVDALALKPETLNAPLFIVATADEESTMTGARSLTKQHLHGAKYAIIGEPTELTSIHAHKGITMKSIRITGQAGHSSNPSLGNNALEAANIVIADLLDFRRELQTRYTNNDFDINVPTLNLGCIHGGDNPNRICGSCELQFDLRPLPGMDIDSLHAQIDARLKPIAEQNNIEIQLETLFGGVNAFHQDKHSDIVKFGESASQRPSQTVAFATEAPFLANLDLETIVMGPGSIDQAHQPDEYIALSQIEPAVNMLTSAIHKFCINKKEA